MLVIQDAWDSGDLPQHAVATIGNFDGIHRGQRAILEQVVARAREVGAPSVLVTFEPHPLALLRPREAPALLTTPQQKERLVATTGIDHMLVLRFDRDLAARSAEEFVRRFLVDAIAVRELYVGRMFRFGRKREGDVALLQKLGESKGFTAQGVDEVGWQGAPVSSSRIRAALLEGRVEDGLEMLGRPYEIEGEIQRGDRMGQKLGWPTINLQSENALIPRDGVYACRVQLPAGTFDAATNVGTRPTVYENFHRVVESHILDFKSDVYGQRVKLLFHRRLREERIFPSIMDLSAQIGRDVEATRSYFATLRRQEAATAAAVAAVSPSATLVPGRVDG
jgi:riboflavin kinase/FMN adenylyltransferase